MPTTPIIVATTAGSAAASAAASRARDAECRSIIHTFDNATATVGDQREFAACVDRFRPATDGDIAAGKIIVIALLLGVAIGAAIGWHREREPIMGAFLGLAATAGAGLILGAVCFVLFG